MPVQRRATARNATAAPLLALALVALAGCSSGASSSGASASAPTQVESASGFDGAALPGDGVAVRDFALRDEDGARVSLSQHRGQVTIVAFPYTRCGAPCTVIAEQIRGALDELAQPPPVLLVSADPADDTPTRVRAFLRRTSLAGRARYLTGTRAQLAPVWRSFKVVLPSAGARAFEQSASVFVLDRAGRERVIYELEQLTPEALAHDVRRLQRER
jgi:protein SCO1